VREALETWRLRELGEVAELLVTELVSNVVRHVGAAATLRVTRAATTLGIEVDDPSTVPATRLERRSDCGPGLGLLLVDELATDWGVELRPDGKTVWFELHISDALDAFGSAPMVSEVSWTLCVDCGAPLVGDEPVPACSSCQERNMELFARIVARRRHRLGFD
jgi:hypothetical protein